MRAGSGVAQGLDFKLLRFILGKANCLAPINQTNSCWYKQHFH